MNRMEQAIFTNMCMVYDGDGNVLVLDRRDTNWGGIMFPGGHVEAEESFTDAVIREIWEETGLTIANPQMCGIKQFQMENARYVVLCYKSNQFTGSLIPSQEGDVFWTRADNLKKLPVAEGMEQMFQVFLDDTISEHYLYQEDGIWRYRLR